VADDGGAVVLFDGTCNFCNGAVQFVIDHERRPDLRFASLQSDAGHAILVRAAGEQAARAIAGEGDPSTLVLVEGDVAYTESSGALRIVRYLRAPWRWARVFVVVPRPIRDAVYRWFARNRYRWFGRTETCRVPTPELRARFLG
jgi:predicted DCC family thiol-disulfide oxidoreductase YuxK